MTFLYKDPIILARRWVFGWQEGPPGRQLPVGEGQQCGPWNGAGLGFLSSLQALLLASWPWHWIRELVTCQVSNKHLNSGTGHWGGGRRLGRGPGLTCTPAPSQHHLDPPPTEVGVLSPQRERGKLGSEPTLSRALPLSPLDIRMAQEPQSGWLLAQQGA